MINYEKEGEGEEQKEEGRGSTLTSKKLNCTSEQRNVEGLR